MKKFNILLAAVAFMAGWSMAGCNSNSESEGQSDSAEAIHEVKPGDEIYKLNDSIVVDKVTVIDFNATWCGPCREFAPNFLAGAEKYKDRARFYSVDIDSNPDFAQRFRINVIPTVVLINPNGDIDTSVGLLDKDEFFDLIEKSLEKARRGSSYKEVPQEVAL